MPARNINLTDHLDAFIEGGIASGRYKNASEVVREGLRLLEQRQAEDELRLERLKEAVQIGEVALQRGEFEDIEPGDLASYPRYARGNAPSSLRRVMPSIRLTLPARETLRSLSIGAPSILVRQGVGAMKRWSRRFCATSRPIPSGQEAERSRNSDRGCASIIFRSIDQDVPRRSNETELPSGTIAAKPEVDLARRTASALQVGN
jgi:antitoxin ParD1/3/4